ncbi:MAG: leucine-rich repeat protein [Bacteroidaceae bacterium]|nr:leucine-rich repeat protein [Bacteroidaceae bacterium]
MKRQLFLFCFLGLSSGVSAQFSGSGSGTQNDPYKIFYAEQLNQVRNCLNQSEVYFKLMSDINLTQWIAANNPGQGWEPIGVESAPFKGIFDGNGKTISGFTINRSSSCVGLFGYISDATISNLTIQGDVQGASYTGAFVGRGSGTLTDLTHEGKTNGTGYIGGIAGAFVGEMSNVSVTGDVTATSSYAGGIAGNIMSSSEAISTATYSGNVTGTNFVGGIAGFIRGNLTNGTVNGNVKGTGSDGFVGGIAGSAEDGTVSYCRSTTTVTGVTLVGGIVGGASGVGIDKCYSYSDVTGSGDYVGGIAGRAFVKKNSDNISESFSFGNINGNNYVGGIAGQYRSGQTDDRTLHTYKTYGSRSDGSQDDTYDETISSRSTIVTAISKCSSIGLIQATGSNVGGVAGSVQGGYSLSVSDRDYFYPTHYDSNHNYSSGCYYYKDGTKVTSTNNVYYYKYTVSEVSPSLTDCYCSGSVSGNQNVGGVIGSMTGGTLANNYSNATISGSEKVGGIAGYIQGFTIKTNGLSNVLDVHSNMAINSSVSATNSLGAIYGAKGDNVSVAVNGSTTDNRKLNGTRLILSGVTQTVQDNDQNGATSGAAYFKLKANYVSHGWDFNSDWTILETESYPYKTWQTAPPVVTSNPVSQDTSISGKNTNGGTVYIKIGEGEELSTTCSGNIWTLSGINALQSGETISLYAKVSDKEASYLAQARVGFPGSGTEADPWRVYTAEDLQGVFKSGYYKQMNDIDLTAWISAHSSTAGWIPVGREGSGTTVYDGDNHEITGLWTNTTEDYTGLFSNFENGTIRNLTVKASNKKVKGGNYTGVLIGRNTGGTFENITVEGSVQGKDYVGGIVGYLDGTPMSTISYVGTITSSTASAHIGGIAGSAQNATLTYCRSYATIQDNATSSASTTPYTGLLVGLSNNNTITNCIANGSITSKAPNAHIGGLVGEHESGTISKSQVTTATINATGGSVSVGGLVGLSSQAAITECLANGSISSTGADSYAGGLVAQNASSGTVENCYSTTNVSSTLYAAGLVGYNKGSVNHCYSSGSVSSTYYGAGLVGYNDGINATVTNCVALGERIDVSDQSGWGIRVLGGFKNSAPTPDESNYAWKDMQISVNGVTKSVEDNMLDGQSLTTAETKSQDSYDALYWDFTNVWGITDGNSYPYLQFEHKETGITLNQETLTLSSAEATTLTAMVMPSHATTPAVEWTSSDERVVTVSDEGVITVVGNGTATVTATTTDGTNFSATCAVTVNLKKFTVPIHGGTIDLTVSVSGNEAYLGKTLVETSCISTDIAGALQIPDTICFGAMKYPITEFRGMTFFGCDKLTSISIPNTVKTICAIAFSNCNSLESLYIPMSVTSITPSPYEYLNNVSTMPVTSIVVDADNTVYDSRNNCNAIIETATSTLIHGCSTTVIPDDIISISSLAFNGVDISSVTIPASVTSIGKYAFYCCGNLTSVVSEIEEPFAFGESAFEGISDDCVLTVPRGTRDAYIAAGWTETVFKGGVVEAKPDQTLELASLPAKTYGDAAYTLPAATSEGLALTWTSSDTDVATISGNTLTVVGAGTATITATQAGNSSYNAFTRDFTLTVAKAPLTITANDATKNVGDENPDFTVSYSGFINGDDENSLTTMPTITTTATIDSPVGTYPITASGAEAANYDISYVEGTLTVKEPEEEDTDISLIDNVVYIEPVEAIAGKPLVLSVKMKNTANIRGFQFDLYLPDGVSVVKSAKGKIQGALTPDRLPEEDEHQLTFSEQEDGAIRFLCSSQYDETFTGSDGEIATLQISIADDMEDGDYPIVQKDIVLNETDITKFYETAYLKSTLTIISILGDINGDGIVNVLDYTGVANRIHGNPPAGFIEKAADVNEDGLINVLDYTGVANIIHTGSPSGHSNAPLQNSNSMIEPQ